MLWAKRSKSFSLLNCTLKIDPTNNATYYKASISVHVHKLSCLKWQAFFLGAFQIGYMKKMSFVTWETNLLALAHVTSMDGFIVIIDRCPGKWDVELLGGGPWVRSMGPSHGRARRRLDWARRRDSQCENRIFAADGWCYMNQTKDTLGRMFLFTCLLPVL